MEDRRITLGNHNAGLKRDGSGYMKDNQFMRLRIKVKNGELVNSARQSIRGAPDSLVEDA